MTTGSINHVALTVSEFESALPFFDGFLGFLGYSRSEVIDHPSSGSRLAVYLNSETGGAINVWAARPERKNQRHEIYAPGLHHIAFNVARRQQSTTSRRQSPRGAASCWKALETTRTRRMATMLCISPGPIA